MNMFKSTSAKTPDEYIDLLDEPRKSEIQKLHDFIRKTLPSLSPFILSGMIGYGKYRYKSPSGKEGDWFLIGLASQKNYISLYVCALENNTHIAEKYKEKLPKTSIGKSCIRFKKAEDIDFNVLKEILIRAEKLGGMNKV
jgi:hypothetical protein